MWRAIAEKIYLFKMIILGTEKLRKLTPHKVNVGFYSLIKGLCFFIGSLLLIYLFLGRLR
jgi:hypothetical protein